MLGEPWISPLFVHPTLPAELLELRQRSAERIRMEAANAIRLAQRAAAKGTRRARRLARRAARAYHSTYP
jgi:hypothetical protein